MSYDYIVVDSSNMAYRQWWAVKDLMHNGVHTGLEYGFIKKIVGYLAKNKDKLVLAWDGKPVRCTEMAGDYKSGRVKVNSNEPSWGPRLEKLRGAFSHLCKTLYHEHEEADDQMAKFVLNNKDKKILIVTNDKDLQQFIGSMVHVEADNVLLNGEKCQEKWGVPAYKIPLYKALDGDGADNIPKVPRLLTTTKINLVNMSSSIEELVANFSHESLKEKEREKLALYKEQVLNSYKMVNLLSLEGTHDITEPDGDETHLRKIIEEMNLKTINF